MPRVTEDMNSILHADYTEEKINVALSQMHPTKALGPDGMCLYFFNLTGKL